MNTPRLNVSDSIFAGCFEQCDDAAFAALPQPALEFLVSLAGSIGATAIFEFGSGKSTAAFLRAGLTVTCIEDSKQWMDDTLALLTEVERAKLTALVKPLLTCWCGAVPMPGWKLNDFEVERLREASLVLVDSPFIPPFREYTLWQALIQARGAVVIDDTRIPTVARFCDRIAAANPHLFHKRVTVGHTLDVFERCTAEPIKLSRGALETLKGWRRYLMRPN